MELVSLDPFRALELPGVRWVKPEAVLRDPACLDGADWVLFPPGWMVDLLVHALGARVFPAPAAYRLGASKVVQTRALQLVAPAHVPRTLIRPAGPEAVEEALEVLGLPLVVKRPRSARGEGVRVVARRAELLAWAQGEETLYAQEYLPIDRDLRVVWVGDRVLAAYWRVGERGQPTNVARGAAVDGTGVPEEALALVARVAGALGVDHAGFDVAWVDGHPFLLEFNVLFGNEGLRRLGVRAGPAVLDWLRRQGGAGGAPGPGLPRAA
ncbi:ATP-grasp domain-containing protein [Inmirania thermothiophila]|uniref:Ribosomal protein S6--L-glutamate ligase n=1 Tax=Inmirania thermothiophila TaxID=1750597 RepID=A0A3N1Y0D5_9GAMM|nr:hypothetical protein [Inmirania thermothiophila]ROR32304.1 ribosomal protein S6--L-glutamate ligase [Inmirania thermothiophila]